MPKYSGTDVLFHFFGGYFHQDWPVTSGSPETALRSAIAFSPIEELNNVHAALAELLSQKRTDQEWAEVLYQCGVCYMPNMEGNSIPQWLSHVQFSVERALASSGEKRPNSTNHARHEYEFSSFRKAG